MLATALRRHRRDGAFDQFQQRLLHAFAGDITGDRRVFALARNLVDFIDIHDAVLRLFDIVVALLQQLLDDVFHVLADIAGFGQGGRIGDGKRHIQQSRQGFGEQGFSRAGRADQQDIAFRQLDLIALAARFNALVVVVHRHRQGLLRPMLTNHVLIEHVEDFSRLGQVTARAGDLLFQFFADDVITQFNALITDEHAGARNQLAHLVLTLPAKGTVENLGAVAAAAGTLFSHAALPAKSPIKTGDGPRISQAPWMPPLFARGAEKLT